jgi:hypothetical protein
MDNLAKVFWMQYSHSAPVFYPISDEGFQVWLGDRKLYSSQSSGFFDHIHGKTLLAWHTSHLRFPACYEWHIGRDICEAALRWLPMGHRRFVSKHTSGFCGVGTKLVQWREQQASPACPRCDLTEDTRHVWLCREPAVFFIWALLKSFFSNWLVLVHTDTAIIYWIIRHLTKWRSSDPFSPIYTDLASD